MVTLAEVEEVREVEVKEANSLLKAGWTLIKQPVKMRVDDEELILYVLAR